MSERVEFYSKKYTKIRVAGLNNSLSLIIAMQHAAGKIFVDSRFMKFKYSNIYSPTGTAEKYKS